MIKQSVVIMKYLNLGCGSHYSTATEWTNLDFTSLDNNVIAHNLLIGIPFEDNSFDLVYHSHVLEHFSKEDGETFIEFRQPVSSKKFVRSKFRLDKLHPLFALEQQIKPLIYYI